MTWRFVFCYFAAVRPLAVAATTACRESRPEICALASWHEGVGGSGASVCVARTACALLFGGNVCPQGACLANFWRILHPSARATPVLSTQGFQ